MYPKRDTSFSIGDPKAKVRIIIFHGYTGSTDEFEPLAMRLHEELVAYVSIPLLPGHGTNEADLVHLNYNDFTHFAVRHVRDIAGDADLILIGHSFGGYLAAECAALYKTRALVLTVVPFRLRFPLTIPGFAWFMRQKLFWKKSSPLQERIERIGLFYYHHMPGIALTLLKEGIVRMNTLLPAFLLPILAIHTTEDPLAYAKSGALMLGASGGNEKNQSIVIERQDHGLFYGKERERVIEHIADFVKESIA